MPILESTWILDGEITARPLKCSFTLTDLVQARGPSRRSQPEADKMEDIAQIRSGNRQTKQMSSSRRWDTRKLRRAKPDGRSRVPPHLWHVDDFVIGLGGA